MKSFREFLEDRQLKLFSTGPVELYHASNTGANNEVLQNFKTQGAKSNIAQGYGQGAGFYVFSDKKNAERHAKSLVDPNARFVSQARTDGKPMIVTVQDILEPENWDVDYELNGNKIVHWIYDNFDYFKDVIDQYYQTNPMGENDWKLRRKMIATQFHRKTGENVKDKKIIFQSATGGGTNQGAESEVDVRRAEIMGKIVNLVQKLEKGQTNLIHGLEERFFANMTPGIAIKYVGNEPLKVKRIEVLEDGKWQIV